MQYCPNCGTAAEGRFCPKCGAAVTAAAPPPPPPNPGNYQPNPGTYQQTPGGYAPPPPGGYPPPPPGGYTQPPPGGYVPPPPGYPPNPGAYPPQGGYPPPAQSLGMEENLAAALCYIPIIGLIFLLIDPYKRNRTIRFHAWQSMFLTIAWFVVSIGLVILWAMSRAILPFGLWTVWSLFTLLIRLAFLAVLIFAAVKAYQRDRLVIPIIGPMAEKQV